ncbi:iron-containing alcohol dehydrogenase [Blastococcus sp. HT6-30]|uniref:iron-containing alcohol dehydrogenase n=1 Tax=Blastococcus sp. HT6-30 TaxID=3144843 RepID=UPI00321906FC
MQGAGALDAAGGLVSGLGTTAVALLDAGIAALVGHRLTTSLRAAGVEIQCLEVDLEVTHENIARTVARIEAPRGRETVLLGVGGGKAIDLARAVAWTRGDAFVTVPTVASNDSPAAMAVAVYDDQHRMVEVIQTGRNPELVLVDTALIGGAPARFLSAGIGDAVAKKFEARSCRAAGGTNQHGTLSLQVAGAIADCCYEALRASAPAALAAVRRREVDQALEDTVEATILMSGLAFENGGLSIAHSLVRGLQSVRGAKEAMHGEHVAYGLLVQLAVEDASDAELLDLRGFLHSVDLPTSLAELGLPDATADELDTITQRCLGSPHRDKTPATVDHAGIRAAIARVEALGTR